MITVRLPDGRDIQVQTDDPKAAAAAARRYLASEQKAAPKAKPAPKPSLTQEITGAMANFNRGLGIGDELAGVVKTGVNLLGGKGSGNIVEDFKSAMGEQRAIEDNFAARRPKTAALAKGTGMATTVIVPTGPSAALMANSGRAVNAARGATAAAATAAGYAAADRGTASERLKAASAAAVDPATLALGAGAGAFATAKPKAVKPEKLPDANLDELRAAKSAAYKAVDESGAQYSADAVDGFIADVTQEARQASINARRHPKAASMLRDIQHMRGRSPTLTELDQLRQVIRRDVANPRNDDAERFFGDMMISKIDDFIDGADAAKMAAGSGEDAASLITTARDLNTRYRKVEAVEGAVQKAKERTGVTGSGGNIDNATRQEILKVKQKGRNFTPEETAMLEKITMGDKGQNLLRNVGKLSPQGNGLMLGLTTIGTMANPAIGVPVLLGVLSKIGADRMTQARVRELAALMAAGGKGASEAAAVEAEIARVIAADPAIAKLRQEMAAKAAKAVGVGRGAATAPEAVAR